MGQGVFVFDLLHYLVLIETKPNALNQAAPLQDWDLSEAFQHLRHLLQARMGNRKREFIQVLRADETRRTSPRTTRSPSEALPQTDEACGLPAVPAGQREGGGPDTAFAIVALLGSFCQKQTILNGSGLPGQRIREAIIQSAYSLTVKPLAARFKEGSDKIFGRNDLDRVSDCIRRSNES